MVRPDIALVLDKLTILGGAEKVAEEIDTAINPTQIITTAVDQNFLPSRFMDRTIGPTWAALFCRQSMFIYFYPLICLLASTHKVKADKIFVYASTAGKFFRLGGRAILYTNYLPRGVHHPELFITNKLMLRFAKLVLPFFKRLEQAQYSKYEKVYCISESTQKLLKREYGVAAEVLYCPVSAGWFEHASPESLNRRNNTYTLVSRLEVSKALEPCLRYCHDNEVPLQVIGDGPLREQFERRFYRIKFLGYLNEPALMSHVRSTRAVFVPTPLEYSMSLLEAFSQGTPVIGLRCDATEELLERRETKLNTRLGIIYDSNAPKDIEKAMNILNRDYHLFDAELIAKAAAEFSPEAFHSRLKNLF